MRTHTPVLRLIAVSLLVMIVMTVAAPARAEAFEFLTAAAIVSAVIAVVLIVVYLVVANVHERRGPAASTPTPTYVVCTETVGQPSTCEVPVGAVAVDVVTVPVPQS